MQIDLGGTIRRLRHRDHKTQEALAEILGVTSQAVSRWESGGSCPDISLIPSIANYFAVSIDELFGYCDERSRRIDALEAQINDRKRRSDGTDDHLAACIAVARNALVEFPGKAKLMLCLASALYTAGYVRHGERHLIDAEGYSVYDTETRKTYEEWQEAIPQGVDKVVTHFVEEGRTSLVAYGSRSGSSVRKLFVPKSSKTAAHVTGF